MSYFLYIGAWVVVMIWSLGVQANLKSKVTKGSQMRARSGITANQVVEQMLRDHEIYGITIEHKPGNLTDCYSPKEGKIYLSDTTYGNDSIAAIAIAAHECGHAIQDKENMPLYEARQLLAPAAGISSRVGPYIVFAGALLSAYVENSGSSVGYYICTFGIVVVLR